MTGRGGGAGLPVGVLIFLLISIVIGVSMLPVITQAIQEAEYGNVTATVAPLVKAPQLFNIPQAPIGALVFLCICFFIAMGCWAWSFWRSKKVVL